MLDSIAEATTLLDKAWPLLVDECRATLGSELHYQAVVYHCLRMAGVPRDQLGMNVKQWIDAPVTSLFQAYDLKKNEAFRGGFEPIPDLVIFRPAIGGDWRRRRWEETLRQMLVAIEIKASERAGSRLSKREILRDIEKLCAHREEVRHLASEFHPVMLVVDTAPLEQERMLGEAVAECRAAAIRERVGFIYLSPDHTECGMNLLD